MTVRVVNSHEAKTKLSALIRDAHAGIDVVLARNGQPVAKLIPWPPPRPERVPGAWRGQVHDDDDLVGPDPAVVALFLGDHESKSE